LPAREHLPPDERRAVGEGDAASKVEGIGASIGRRLPTGGERRAHTRIRGESREAVEEVAYRSASRHVGGEGGVERPWIIVVARVNERAPIGAAASPTASQDDDGEEHSDGTTHDVLA
jgi:hypothetical protein